MVCVHWLVWVVATTSSAAKPFLNDLHAIEEQLQPSFLDTWSFEAMNAGSSCGSNDNGTTLTSEANKDCESFIMCATTIDGCNQINSQLCDEFYFILYDKIMDNTCQ